ncbi:hypothetical protein AB836_01795 [Rickettsiales bacterium (ex Bugula neritina AB1)]|nr:hypothetical protein AB836_01795 [Rickettsiales bacterium (ex Bugula neritina AB1)]
MQILKKIIEKYTKFSIDAKHLFNHTELVIDNSIFIVENIRNISLELFSSLIRDMINKIDIKGFLCTEISKKYLPNNINIPIITTTPEIIQKIIDEYYYKRPKKIIGITGSYGKTTTTQILFNLLKKMNIKTFMNNSRGFTGIEKNFLKVTVTGTPSNLDLKRILHESVNNDIEVAILEVTHAGIHQNRIKDIKFDGGIFTGFTKDHVEYFKNLKDYYDCKESFIKTLPIKVVNEEIFTNKFSKNLHNLDKIPHIVYGESINNITDSSFTYKNVMYKKSFNLPYYIKNNLIASMILLYELGYKDVFNHMNISIPLPGIIEKVGVTKTGAEIYIDNAYRLNVIEKIINIFKKKKRIILVTGAGGNRNRGNTYRRDIGNFSKKTYITIVTDENPREEDPKKIRKQIIGKNSMIFDISSRILGIQTAINMAAKNHVILIIGKGAEKSIIYKNYTSYISDKESVKFCLLNIN